VTWQQMLIAYAASGIAAYVTIMLVIRFYESKTPAAVFREWGAGLERWAEEVEQKKNPSRLRKIKNASVKWVAHLWVAVLIVAVWPVALVIKARVWHWLRAQTGVHLRNIEYIAKDIGLSFAKDEGVSPVEQILILDRSRDGMWMYEAPGFLALVIQANELQVLSNPNSIFYETQEWLLLSPDELNSYCIEHKLSEQDEAQVMRWTRWHKSDEAKALEAFFRRLWQQWAESNAEYVRTKAWQWMPFPRAVVDLALAKSHRRCCVCHDFNAPRVDVCYMSGAPGAGARTIEQAICLCDKCSKVWSFQMEDPLEPKYLELKAKRDKWWEHCQRHPEEPYGLFLDVGFRAVSRSADVHRYRLVATYTNTTKTVQEGWQLNIKIPGLVPLRYENYDRTEVRVVGAYVSNPPHAQLMSSSTERIMPGESVDIVPLEGRYIEYEMNEKVYNGLKEGWNAVPWELTIPNSPKIEGEKKVFELQDWHQKKMAA